MYANELSVAARSAAAAAAEQCETEHAERQRGRLCACGRGGVLVGSSARFAHRSDEHGRRRRRERGDKCARVRVAARHWREREEVNRSGVAALLLLRCGSGDGNGDDDGRGKHHVPASSAFWDHERARKGPRAMATQ